MTDEEAAQRPRIDAETTPGTSAHTPRLYTWPKRQVVFWYGWGGPVQWQVHSICPACGGDIDATGYARPGEMFSQIATCDQCGASYTVEGMIAE